LSLGRKLTVRTTSIVHLCLLVPVAVLDVVCFVEVAANLFPLAGPLDRPLLLGGKLGRLLAARFRLLLRLLLGWRGIFRRLLFPLRKLALLLGAAMHHPALLLVVLILRVEIADAGRIFILLAGLLRRLLAVRSLRLRLRLLLLLQLLQQLQIDLVDFAHILAFKLQVDLDLAEVLYLEQLAALLDRVRDGRRCRHARVRALLVLVRLKRSVQRVRLLVDNGFLLLLLLVERFRHLEPFRCHVEREPAALPVVQYHLRHRLHVRLALLQQLARLARNLLEEIDMVRPLGHAVRLHHVLLADALQHLLDVVLRIVDQLDPHHRLQHLLRVGFRGRVDDARAIDQEDALHQRDVLPHLRFARDRGHLAHLLAAQRVDDGRLAHVRVAYEADADLLLVHVQLADLAQQIDQRTLAERVRERGVERDRRILLAQYRDPALRHPDRHQVDLVQHEEQMLVRLFLAQERLDVLRARAHRVARVQHLQQHVRRVHHLVQLVPDALAAASGENVLPHRILHPAVVPLDVVILRLVVLLRRLFRRARQVLQIAHLQRRPLAQLLLAERRVVAFRVEQMDPLVAGRLVQQRDRQVGRLHDHLVRVLHRLAHLFLELLQRLLRDDARVGEPLGGRFDARHRTAADPPLERGGRDDLSPAVPLRLKVPVHLQPLDGGLRARLGHPLQALGRPVRVHRVGRLVHRHLPGRPRPGAHFRHVGSQFFGAV
uniref:Uncharacterized protein n=1 Tax=Anopheles coluzzii TaxID=1518534 RepID=A0A8W7PVQ6_ANOCL